MAGGVVWMKAEHVAEGKPGARWRWETEQVQALFAGVHEQFLFTWQQRGII